MISVTTDVSSMIGEATRNLRAARLVNSNDQEMT